VWGSGPAQENAVTRFLACDLAKAPPGSPDEQADVAGRDIDLVPPTGNERAVMLGADPRSPQAACAEDIDGGSTDR
jgi:hypothetical protein